MASFMPPNVEWRQKLNRPVLTDKHMLLIEERLDMRLYGMRKDSEYTVGFRILHENDGYADMLLMRRDFDQGGFFFDLYLSLNQVTDEENKFLYDQVAELIAELDNGA